jgi:hypothetical protein
MEMDDTFDAESPAQIALEDVTNYSEEDTTLSNLVAFVNDKYHKAEDTRRQDEERWLRAYRNYRGIYGPDVRFTEAERSRIFVKVTKTKVLAAYGQIIDVLFANQSFPITVEPTRIPEGVEEAVHFDPQMAQMQQQLGITPDATTGSSSPFGFAGDGQDLPPGATFTSLTRNGLGPLADKLADVEGLKKGVGQTPSSVTFYPAMVAAKKMQKKIYDQLEEAHASKQLRSTAFEMALFGEGIMKGPFAIDKEYPNWDEDGTYSPTIKTIPSTSHVSVWNFYPDPDANNMDEAQYVIERHKMSRTQLRALKKRPFFRDKVIDSVIELGEGYTKKYWEDDLRDYTTDYDIERFEVLEYWGIVDRETLEKANVDIPDDLGDLDELQANIWYCNGRILRAVINPFKPSRIPYYAVPYELNPYSFFGVGIAENMDDTQTLMNGFMRMAVDNAVLSGNLLIEIDETNLVPGQDLSIYPGKVFRRQAGAPGQAIFGTKFPNVSNENMQLFDKARVLADESTGLPSFSHGQTGVAGVGRTASGISMLMNAAAGGVKTVIKNVDDYLLAPLGKAMFSFNMQFDFDAEIKGDLEVRARGTESLMANEVRSQRLMQFLQIASSPALAPFAKFPYIVREIAKSMDLDPEKVTNSMEEAALQAQLMQQNAPPQPAQQSPGGPPGVQDTAGTGGGNIGIGQSPVPGEQGFTGNDQGGQPASPQGGQQAQAPLQ